MVTLPNYVSEQMVQGKGEGKVQHKIDMNLDILLEDPADHGV